MTNDKQKTAMQMAIAHYKKLSEEGSNQAYVIAKFLEENFLEMEKEQIMNAHIESGARLEDISIHSAEQYYNKTYGGAEQ